MPKAPAIDYAEGDRRLFPDGPEQTFVLATCQGCHTLAWITRSGGAQEDWEDRLVRMLRAARR